MPNHRFIGYRLGLNDCVLSLGQDWVISPELWGTNTMTVSTKLHSSRYYHTDKVWLCDFGNTMYVVPIPYVEDIMIVENNMPPPFFWSRSALPKRGRAIVWDTCYKQDINTNRCIYTIKHAKKEMFDRITDLGNLHQYITKYTVQMIDLSLGICPGIFI